MGVDSALTNKVTRLSLLKSNAAALWCCGTSLGKEEKYG
jgi:hypothetical protein